MQRDVIRKTLAAVCVGAGALFAACNEKATSPMQHEMHASAAVIPELPAFTERAPLDPFFINQPSQLMIRTDARTDFVIQRVVSDPGAGKWHTHPGPSFGIVKQGTVMITRWSKKTGCVSNTYTEGQAYYEVADEIHRATVLNGVPAVEYKARFYAPVNGAFTSFIADEDAPDCAK
ncbi:MAG TPA: hypothetical protein VJT85_07880 [Gemmatimonadaceae bacterium]|nr:hypothetical protein [Gemmatimonadaceae bacterium]